MAPKISIVIVNLNCMQDTRELIDDLDRQLFVDFDVVLYDQGSTEYGTLHFLSKLRTRKNYRIVQNNENVPLNHIWNEFAHNATGEYLAFLNNDIRVTSNYLEDTHNVLVNDKRVGIAIHATNNRRYSTATSPTRHILESTLIKQGWEFTLHRDDWVPVPESLKFYCGDDFIFGQMHNSGKKVGTITSSPVMHKLSKTRKGMDREAAAKIRAQAMTDIETYKGLGFPHTWNNISKYSRLEPEFTFITEVTTEQNLCKFSDYQKRLQEHLTDSSRVSGVILDVGVNDAATFDVMLDSAIEHNKQLVGIDNVEPESSVIASNTATPRPLNAIKGNPTAQTKADNFTLHGNGLATDMDEFNEPISFAFIGIFNPVKLKRVLPKLWDNVQPGGTLFFPYYNYNKCPAVKQVVDEFFADKRERVILSRPNTFRNNIDTYIAVKCFTTPMLVPKRTKPLVIASVLKMHSDKQTNECDYDETYVNKLASAVRRHTTVDYEFVCLTDGDPDLIDSSLVHRVIPLEFGLDGWWSKFELFRPSLFNGSQVLYFDLDTLITDSIDDFANYGGDFLALRDLNTLTSLASGILSWNPDITEHIFYKYIRGLLKGKLRHQQFSGGDQEAIEHLLELDHDWVQDMFPNKMCSFKYQCYDGATRTVSIPDGGSVVCFHGRPKMGELVHDPVISKHWK